MLSLATGLVGHAAVVAVAASLTIHLHVANVGESLRASLGAPSGIIVGLADLESFAVVAAGPEALSCSLSSLLATTLTLVSFSLVPLPLSTPAVLAVAT